MVLHCPVNSQVNLDLACAIFRHGAWSGLAAGGSRGSVDQCSFAIGSFCSRAWHVLMIFMELAANLLRFAQIVMSQTNCGYQQRCISCLCPAVQPQREEQRLSPLPGDESVELGACPGLEPARGCFCRMEHACGVRALQGPESSPGGCSQVNAGTCLILREKKSPNASLSKIHLPPGF